MTPTDLERRTFEYGVRIVKLTMFLAKKGVRFRLIDQLIGAGTSVGANVEESHSADSKRDFGHKRSIALRECRESVYFLRVLLASGLATDKMVAALISEGRELMNILARGIATLKRSMNG